MMRSQEEAVAGAVYYQQVAKYSANIAAVYLGWAMNPALPPDELRGLIWSAKKHQEEAYLHSSHARIHLLALLSGI